MPGKHASVEERLHRSLVAQESGCLEWQLARTADGYGRIRVGNRTELTHRVAYRLATGQDPGDLLVCHTCDNPPCCKFEHLFLGTHTDNMQDAIEKGRSVRHLRRTHCLRGHELTEENIYTDSHGKRSCKTCRREALRRFRSSREEKT